MLLPPFPAAAGPLLHYRGGPVACRSSPAAAAGCFPRSRHRYATLGNRSGLVLRCAAGSSLPLPSEEPGPTATTPELQAATGEPTAPTAKAETGAGDELRSIGLDLVQELEDMLQASTDELKADLQDQLVPLTQRVEQQEQQVHALRSEVYALQMWLQQRLQQQQGALDAIGQQLGELQKGQLRVDSRAASAAHQATKAAAVVAAVQEQQAAVLKNTTGVMAKVEVVKAAVLAANRNAPQQQKQKPNLSYKELVSSAKVVEHDGMSSSMRSHARRTAAKAVSKFPGRPNEVAEYVGQGFVHAYGDNWDCVVTSTGGGEKAAMGVWVRMPGEGQQYIHLVVGRWHVVLWRSAEYDEAEGEYGEEEYDEGEYGEGDEFDEGEYDEGDEYGEGEYDGHGDDSGYTYGNGYYS